MLEPKEAAQQSGFLSDARILEQFKGTSSLQPEPPAPDAVQTPDAAAPIQADPLESPAPSTEEETPAPAPQEAEPVSEDDFSADLPDLPSAPMEEAPTEIPADSPLSADAPMWQHEAFRNLKDDPELSEEDKAEIAKLPPGQWTRVRRQAKASKILGKYRDKNVPIQDVMGLLEKQDADRTSELTTYAVSRMVDSTELSEEFAKRHPEAFSRLMVNIATQNPKFLTTILERQGYKVVDGSFDVDAALSEFEDDPLWDVVKDSPMGEAIRSKYQAFAESAKGPKALDPDELANELKGEPTQDQREQMEQVQKVQDLWMNTRDKVWLSAVSQGLQAGGIKPPTPAEAQKSPALANLKNMIYNLALRGMPGVLPDWDEQSYAFGEKQDGFRETAVELQQMVQRGELDRFSETAPALNEFYYNYGGLRASIPLVRNMYNYVNRMLAEAAPAAPDTAPAVPEPLSNGGPQDGRQFKFGSDRLVLERLGKL